jgi:oligoendopeptidase F
VADNQHLKDGCGWQHILHTFLWPFYAIDYGLAQVVALEFYRMAQTQPEETWQSYLTFCRKTGELNFSQLLEQAGLGSPFEEASIKELADWLEGQLLA